MLRCSDLRSLERNEYLFLILYHNYFPRNVICKTCYAPTEAGRTITRFPNFFQLRYGKEISVFPKYLKKEITIQNVKYDIVGATYGNGSHFVFRYFDDNKVFEADGMRKSVRSSPNLIIREAISIEIRMLYELALAGRIAGKTVNDVYYIRR